MQGAQVAGDAPNKMIGLTKEQVLACMGPPLTKASEAATEVWSYQSGNNRTSVSTSGTFSGDLFASAGLAESRYCTVKVAMQHGRVIRTSYIGPTGGVLTPNERCASAVQNCMQ